jgi:hypothetical protein
LFFSRWLEDIDALGAVRSESREKNKTRIAPNDTAAMRLRMAAPYIDFKMVSTPRLSSFFANPNIRKIFDTVKSFFANLAKK